MASHPPEATQTDDNQQASPDTEGFGSAFAERIGGKKSEPEEDATADKAAADVTASDDAAAESAEADKSKETDAAAEKAAANPGSPFDPWTGLSPEQAEYFKRLQRSEGGLRGSLAALKRRQQNGSQQETQPPKKQSDPQPQGEGDKSSRAERIKAAADEYPDAVGAISEDLVEARNELADAKKRIDELTEMVKPVTEAREEEDLREAISKLEKEHPDFREIADDPSWANWLGDQRESIQKLGVSYDPAEVSAALRLFKAERAEAMATADQSKTEKVEPKPTATDQRREQQLEGSRVVPSRGAGAAAGVPNDFSSAFKARSKKD